MVQDLAIPVRAAVGALLHSAHDREDLAQRAAPHRLLLHAGAATAAMNRGLVKPPTWMNHCYMYPNPSAGAMPRPPTPVIVVAGIAAAIAALDIVDTILAMLRPEGTGRVMGTFVRDGLLVLAAGFVVRRATWARWTLVVLFALTLLRAYSSDVYQQASAALALVGLVTITLAPVRAWFVTPAGPSEA